MFKSKYGWLLLIAVILFCLVLSILHLKLSTSGYLYFSDAAKYGDIARNIYEKKDYVANFTFFSPKIFPSYLEGIFPARGIPVLTPFILSLLFNVFGVGDFALVFYSLMFFVVSLVGVFLLSKKIFNNHYVAVLSVLAVGTNIDLINYSISGATEMLFIAETLYSIYFLTLRKRWATWASFAILILMYLTRPQAFINIGAVILFYFLTRFKTKVAILYFLACAVLFFAFDYFVIPRLPENLYLISVTARGSEALTQYVPGESFSQSLRGTNVIGPIAIAFKKLFYVSYNFYKLLPQIMNPYLVALFVVGMFITVKNTNYKALKISTVILIFSTFVITALSIPFFRYLHPVVPFVYIFAVNALYVFVSDVYKERRFVNWIILLLLSLFVVGQTLGIILLDSRNLADRYNFGKKPAYVALSQILKDNTDSNDTVLTNLDTWGSWYGKRSTVWFPLEPKQIIDPATGTIPFDAIYLTNYLITDENYLLGNSWQQILDNPDSPDKWNCEGCLQISEEFVLKGRYSISSSDIFEKQDLEGLLLLRSGK